MQVGFIGIGNMGAPMAASLLRGGHQVTVYDLDGTRSARFARDHGCQAATELAGIAAMEAIITMLPTGQIVREVLLGADGAALARRLRAGTLVIDMSTSEPLGTRALGAQLAALGVVLIDAPVSGGVPRAISGTLTIMAGSDDPQAIARARPLLSCMGERLFETGALGSGHAMKALNNFVAASGYAAAAEALTIGRRFGLDPAAMIDILNVSTGRNFNTELVMKQQVLSGEYASGFALGLLAKDVRIAADLGEAVHVDAPLTRLVRERYALARERLGAARDNTEAMLGWGDELPQP